MLNVLYPNINWSEVKNVGFDMDGTLYDEFDFICTVYKEIVEKLEHFLTSKNKAYQYMLKRWVEKGSSYNKIFDEAFTLFSKNNKEKEDFVISAIRIYRNSEPSLNLSKRLKLYIEYFSKNYNLFLVSDGNKLLQKRKFNSLKLDNYFNEDSVVFTDSLGPKFSKPDPKALSILNLYENKETVFFGDRQIDHQFCINGKIKFIKVYNMFPKDN